MAERFLVLRGTHAGPIYLRHPRHPEEAFAWTEWCSEVWRFDTRAEAATIQQAFVSRGVAVAVVPDGDR